MLAGFPSAVPAVEGDISPMELLRVFRHLIDCAKSIITAYHELNFLFLVVPPSVWPVYSNGPRATPPVRPGANPAYIDGNAVQNQMIKDTHFEMTSQVQQQQWQQQNNNGAGGQQRMPTWQQQTNATVTFQPQPMLMPTQQPQQQMQYQPPQQQQWANFGGVCAPVNQMGMYGGTVSPPVQGNTMWPHY